MLITSGSKRVKRICTIHVRIYTCNDLFCTFRITLIQKKTDHFMYFDEWLVYMAQAAP